MQIIPLSATPNQTLAIILADQTFQLHVYQKTTGLYMDVMLDNQLKLAGVICQNANRIVRDLYFGIAGDFAFFDTLDTAIGSDPDYTGLGSRFQLVYIEASELPEGIG